MHWQGRSNFISEIIRETTLLVGIYLRCGLLIQEQDVKYGNEHYWTFPCLKLTFGFASYWKTV